MSMCRGANLPETLIQPFAIQSCFAILVRVLFNFSEWKNSKPQILSNFRTRINLYKSYVITGKTFQNMTTFLEFLKKCYYKAYWPNVLWPYRHWVMRPFDDRHLYKAKILWNRKRSGLGKLQTSDLRDYKRTLFFSSTQTCDSDFALTNSDIVKRFFASDRRGNGELLHEPLFSISTCGPRYRRFSWKSGKIWIWRQNFEVRFWLTRWLQIAHKRL